jgi:DNA-binding MarR family transcriptional regulator
MDEAPVRLGELRHALGFMLRLAQQQAFDAFFDAFAGAGMGPGAFSVLVGIRENPDVRQGSLAQALRIKRANMAKLVRKLERDGLIARTVPDDDRRANLLRLTEQGEAMVDQWAPSLFGHDRALAHGLTGAERATLLSLLRRIADVPAEPQSTNVIVIPAQAGIQEASAQALAPGSPPSRGRRSRAGRSKP